MRTKSYLWACLATVFGYACGDAPPLDDLHEIVAPAIPGAAEPNLAVSPSGSVYLSWLEPEGEGHAMRFAELQGNTWSAPRTVASGTSWFVNWADFPSLLPLSDSLLAAHWLARSGAGRYAYDVKVSVSADAGATWSAAITPHTDGTASEHGFVSMWPAADGRFGLVWLDGRNFPAAEARRAAGDSTAEEEMTLRSATLGADGSIADEALIDGRICDCCQTSAAVTARGPVVVYRDRSPAEVRDIYVTRLVDGSWTPGRAVAADGWEINACPVNGPAVAARHDRVAVAWFTMAGGERRVYAALSNDAGATFGARIRIDDGLPVGRVGVVMTDDGALVSWLEETGSAGEVRVRRVRADATTGTSLTVASTLANRPAGFPRIAASNGRAVLAWTVPPSDSAPSRVRTIVARMP